jgi:2-desacetyl-2-hydroxyethyl bacteriochlorophyllide A dehydrogenase
MPVSLCLYFTSPGQVELRQEPLPPPGPDQALVQTLLSTISPGTEMLIYRGDFPAGLAVDESLPALASPFAYPLKYGYAAVGRVIEVGDGVDPAWLGRPVFSFQPHQSHFIAGLHELLPIPGGLAPEEAAFLPNIETAVNLVMDGAPLIGEHIAVFGQGIIGLLTTSLLARHPLGSLVAFDRFPLRRQASLDSGAHLSLDPGEATQNIFPRGADLVYELSGAPAALDQALALAGFASRVVVGSWYGQKSVSMDLGGRFHRSRIRIISSQVSTISPELSGRWDKPRRFELAWDMLRLVRPARFITHRFPIHQAAQAYQLIDQHPAETIQVLLTYP